MQPFWWHSRLYPDPASHNAAGESFFIIDDENIAGGRVASHPLLEYTSSASSLLKSEVTSS